MLLAIDSGNTNIVFAVFDDEGAVRGEWRSSSHTDRTADEFGVWLEQLMKSANLTPADITASIIATVVPATLFNLKTLCREYFGCDPLIVGAVAYTPNVVPIWEGIREYFNGPSESDAPMDFVLYSNYGRLVTSLIAGHIDIAWNTNLAYVRTVMQTDGHCIALAQRDT
ncbi:MAG: type III pantothenate kinase, partial [Proteobacteria bacterium]|nr:type III pantothenate kinase [Pseudomonadota bacterium]